MRDNKIQKKKCDCVEDFKQNIFYSQDIPVGGHCDNLDALFIRTLLEA